MSFFIIMSFYSTDKFLHFIVGPVIILFYFQERPLPLLKCHAAPRQTRRNLPSGVVKSRASLGQSESSSPIRALRLKSKTWHRMYRTRDSMTGLYDLEKLRDQSFWLTKRENPLKGREQTDQYTKTDRMNMNSEYTV